MCTRPSLSALSALLMAALGSLPLHGQQDTTLTLDVQIRARSEWRDGYKVAAAPGTEADLVTIQRSRLTLNGDRVVALAAARVTSQFCEEPPRRESVASATF